MTTPSTTRARAPRRVLAVTGLGALALVGTVACSGRPRPPHPTHPSHPPRPTTTDGTGPSTTATPTTAPGTTTPTTTPTTAGTNRVTFGLAEGTIELTQGTVRAGRNSVTATNTGRYAHEIEFIRAESAASLPKRADGSVDTASIRSNVLGEIYLQSGATSTRTFTFTPGKYVGICNIVSNGYSHFAGGQYIEFTVS